MLVSASIFQFFYCFFFSFFIEFRSECALVNIGRNIEEKKNKKEICVSSKLGPTAIPQKLSQNCMIFGMKSMTICCVYKFIGRKGLQTFHCMGCVRMSMCECEKFDGSQEHTNKVRNSSSIKNI